MIEIAILMLNSNWQQFFVIITYLCTYYFVWKLLSKAILYRYLSLIEYFFLKYRTLCMNCANNPLIFLCAYLYMRFCLHF